MTARSVPGRLLLAALLFARPPSAGAAPAGLASPQSIDPPAARGALAPSLAVAGGRVWLTWLERTPARPAGASSAAAPERTRLLASALSGAAWDAPREIAVGDDFFANWADVPGLAEEPGGALVAHWLARLGEGTYAYGVRLARSIDGGATWRPFGLLHDDASPTEHGFVSWFRDAGGLQAAWLDGRRLARGHGNHDGGGEMELRAAPPAFGDGPAASRVLDPRVCECCATDGATAAAGPVVVYRDRSAREVRDVAIVRATAAGWSTPRLVHADGWTIHGCPVNGPAVAANGERVAVVWFTAAGEAPRVQAALSADGGASFGPPVVLDRERPPGRVDAAFAADGSPLAVWLAAGPTPDRAAVRLARLGRDGTVAAVLTLAETSSRRASGVPRLAVDPSGRAVVAWIEDGAGPARLRAALVELP